MMKNHFGKKGFVSKAFVFGMVLCFLGTSIIPNLSGSSGMSNIPEQKISSTAKDFNFDIAYIDDVYAELPYGGGVMFVAASFGLVINSGSEPITKEDLDAAGVMVTSNIVGAHINVGFNTDNQFQPIQANNAWGSVNYQNLFLIDLLENGEVLQNMTPYQTFYLGVFRDNYTGVANFNISIQIRDRIIYLETTITFVNSTEHNVVLISGERADSTYHPNQPPTPPTITGPHYGKTNTMYTFSLGSITDPDGDQFYVLWVWGDDNPSDWLGPYDSGTTINASHEWSEPRNYTIRVILKDIWGVLSNWSAPFFITIVENKLPNPPNITGPHYGKINTDYTFSIGPITNPDGDQLYGFWNWGDGNTGWLGPYDNGQTINISHAWSKPGNYTIRVKFKDIWGAESNWSDPFFIEIVKLKTIFFLGTFEPLNQTEDLIIIKSRFFMVFPSIQIFYTGRTIVMSKDYLGHFGTSFTFGIGGVAII